MRCCAWARQNIHIAHHIPGRIRLKFNAVGDSVKSTDSAKPAESADSAVSKKSAKSADSSDSKKSAKSVDSSDSKKFADSQKFADSAKSADSADLKGVDFQHLKKVFESMDGVKSLKINLLARSMVIEYDKNRLPPAAIPDFLANAQTPAALQFESDFHQHF